MSHYWARFQKVNNDIFRYDTRIYLKPSNSPREDDVCIGAIIGKNPGSAVATCLDKTSLQKINLDGDNLLPNIKSIFLKAYEKSNIPIDKNVYIQVLNLMYICDKDLSQAIKKILDHKNPTICLSEGKYFPFVWYVWGSDDVKLNPCKKRFVALNSDAHFFINTKTEEIISRRPTSNEPARHPQGMKHNLVIPYISEILISVTEQINI